MTPELGLNLLLGVNCGRGFRPESLVLERICRQAELVTTLPAMDGAPVDLLPLLVTPRQRFAGIIIGAIALHGRQAGLERLTVRTPLLPGDELSTRLLRISRNYGHSQRKMIASDV